MYFVFILTYILLEMINPKCTLKPPLGQLPLTLVCIFSNFLQSTLKWR